MTQCKRKEKRAPREAQASKTCQTSEKPNPISVKGALLKIRTVSWQVKINRIGRLKRRIVSTVRVKSAHSFRTVSTIWKRKVSGVGREAVSTTGKESATPTSPMTTTIRCWSKVRTLQAPTLTPSKRKSTFPSRRDQNISLSTNLRMMIWPMET